MTLAGALDCPEPVAWVLVRRGLGDIDAAREFLASDGPLDPPESIPGIAEAADRLALAVRRGESIVVHGDYDCDGITSTAILLEALRARGGRAEAFLPSRFTDGYGVSIDNVERIAAEGCKLLVCVDCGTTAVDALIRAQELGMESIVCDHHLAGGRRPPAILANPALGRGVEALPAAAGVTFKLVQALAARLDGSGSLTPPPESCLDLVALATVADAVPLIGENRRLVARGLEVMREGRRPGLVALCNAAETSIRSATARTLGFTIAPAINAAGRLTHPSEALELLMATGSDPVAPLASRLWELNRTRREIERDITEQAVAIVEADENQTAGHATLVVSGRAWHEGVVGIVASRLVERFGRPALVLAEVDDGVAKGSGRSLPGVDLHALVAAASGRLTRWGGHQGAVGLQLPISEIAAFTHELAAASEPARGAIERARIRQVDAVVGVRDLGLSTAEAFEALAPFGRGNPEVGLVVPGCGISHTEAFGNGHLRMRLNAGGAHARAIRFGGRGRLPAINADDRHDVVIRLGVNRWKDTVSPEVIVEALTPITGGEPLRGACRRACTTACDERIAVEEFRALIGDDEGAPVAPSRTMDPPLRDRRGQGVATSVIAALAGADGGVIAVVSDAARRAAALDSVLEPARLGAEAMLMAGARCDAVQMRARQAQARGGPMMSLVEYERLPELAIIPGTHVVLIDPPTEPVWWDWALAHGTSASVHLAWGDAEALIAAASLEERFAVRTAAGAVWRLLSDGVNRQWGAALMDELVGDGAPTRHPAAVARAVAALAEIGFIVLDDAGVRGVSDAPRRPLEQAPRAVAAAARVADATAFLAEVGTTAGGPLPVDLLARGGILSV